MWSDEMGDGGEMSVEDMMSSMAGGTEGGDVKEESSKGGDEMAIS